ncbi:flagellar filament capping protein FliD [Paenibacillus sp. 2003]|uniref:flagellar filament capping protein FliD n=1 Tax=Paenibacillus TaxID=44249 RepID=UPI00285E457B|nr:flagellar filament capping protein FliD [Paenibacillus sp. 2003]MDR6720305.1 flagellar hook-associated protein 2 [Paenibacillus sp. 2003]
MNMRINGFSGMDIDSMVKSLMTVKRVPLDKLNQQKQILEWTRDSYREINSKIVQLSDKLQKMSFSDATNTQKSTVSGNTTAVRAEATSEASSVPFSITEIKLAKQAQMQNNSRLEIANQPTAKVTLDTTLADLTGTSAPSYDLNINDKSVSFLSTDSLSVVIARINSSIPTVTANFDEISGKLSITSKEYGKVISDTGTGGTQQPSTLSTALGLTISPPTAGEVSITNGTDTVKYTLNDNKLKINGINLTFLEETTATNPTTITTQSDPTKAVDTIKSFVDTYNELLGLLNGKISEQKFRDFQPLTADQKKDMKEDDIKNWEEKAKSGLLKNDSILSAAVNSMRTVVTGNLKMLSEVGITTGQYYEKGKLQIDESKLKDALTTNPDKVLNIFRGSVSDVNSKPLFSEMRGELNSTLDMLVKKVGTSKLDSNASMTLKTESIMGEQLKQYNKRASEMERKVTDWEKRYYKQFAAMEKAMSQFQSQSSSLASYFQ